MVGARCRVIMADMSMSAGNALTQDPDQTVLRPGSNRAGQDQVNALIVPYAYARVHAEVARRKSVVFLRGASTCLTILVLIGLQVWRHLRTVQSPVFGWPYWAALGVSMAINLGILGFAILAWLRARKRAAGLRPEAAMTISRIGVELTGVRTPWAEVSGLQARTERFGRGDTFLVHRTNTTPVTVPFDVLDVAPSTLDSAARAYSGGRIGVDFSRMDN